MISSFKKHSGAAPAAETKPETPAHSHQVDPEESSTTLAIPTKPVDGEFRSEDFVIPKLHLVQSVGPLSEMFQPGSFVYNKELVLTDGVSPLSLTVVRIRKQYAENVEYGGDEIPRMFDTLDQVRTAGGWIDWRDNQKPPFSPVLHVLALIKSPSGENPLFPYEFGGVHYGIGLWTLRSTGFTRAGKTIITASQFALKDGLHKGGWTLTSKREKIGMNFVFVPVLRHEARHSTEFAEFAGGLMG